MRDIFKIILLTLIIINLSLTIARIYFIKKI